MRHQSAGSGPTPARQHARAGHVVREMIDEPQIGDEIPERCDRIERF
jgi:hypothetical protein